MLSISLKQVKDMVTLLNGRGIILKIHESLDLERSLLQTLLTCPRSVTSPSYEWADKKTIAVIDSFTLKNLD